MIKRDFEKSAAECKFFAVVSVITDDGVCFEISEDEDGLDFNADEWILDKKQISHLGDIEIYDLYEVTQKTNDSDDPHFLFNFIRNVAGEEKARLEKALGYTLDTDIDEFWNDPRFA